MTWEPKYDEKGRLLIAGYKTTLWATLLSAALFGILCLFFWIRWFRYGGQRWMIFLCIGTWSTAVGYGIRAGVHFQPDGLGIYIPQATLILLAPCSMLAQYYIILPRLATWLDCEDCLFFPSRLVVRFFIWSDVITFIWQSSGVGLSAQDGSTQKKIGTYITLGGVIAQMVSFATFCALNALFGIRVWKRYPYKLGLTPNSRSGSFLRRMWVSDDWRVLYAVLSWNTFCLFVRTVFRTAEFAQGDNGTLRNTEIYGYMLDTLPIFLGLLTFVLVWPPAVQKRFEEQAGETGGKGEHVDLNNRKESAV